MQVPKGDPKQVCPLHKRSCEKVCHSCPWWVQLRSAKPGGTDVALDWQCAATGLLLVLTGLTQEVLRTGASIEGLRNVAQAANVLHSPPTMLQQPQALRSLTDGSC